MRFPDINIFVNSILPRGVILLGIICDDTGGPVTATNNKKRCQWMGNQSQSTSPVPPLGTCRRVHLLRSRPSQHYFTTCHLTAASIGRSASGSFCWPSSNHNSSCLLPMFRDSINTNTDPLNSEDAKSSSSNLSYSDGSSSDSHSTDGEIEEDGNEKNNSLLMGAKV